MDKLILIGFFLMPFENFIFAPSYGWATITPIIFFLYIIMNFKLLYKSICRYSGAVILLLTGIGINIFNALLFSPLNPGMYFLRAINAIISYGMGLVSLYAFDIYFLQKNNNIQKVEKIIIFSYYIALFFGVVQFLTIKLHISALYSFFDMIFKRNSLQYNRVQFFFTEPSFIGMHLFGILLPVYLLGKNTKIRNLIFVFSAFSVIFGCGVKIILDIIIALAIIILYSINFRKARSVFTVIVLALILTASFSYVYHSSSRASERLQKIIHEGVYADGSLASRWFRINASVEGYKTDLVHAAFGYGMGNSSLALEKGYQKAKSQYTNSFDKEVNDLEFATLNSNDNTTHCMYTRLITEYGFIIFSGMIFYWLKMYQSIKDKKWKAFFMIMVYLYLQFDAYGFYTYWLFFIIYKKHLLQKREFTNLQHLTRL